MGQEKILKIQVFGDWNSTGPLSTVSLATVNYRDYYFNGIIDLEKYPQFKYNDYRKDLETEFYIYDNKIFVESEGDYDWPISLKISDGSYDLTTMDNIELRISSVNGEITNFIIKNTEKLKNKKKLNFANDSCKIADFIFKFKLAYYQKKIKSSRDHQKLFGLGDYNSRENKYFFDSWVLSIFKYKDKIMSSYMTNEGEVMVMNGHSCFEYEEVNESSFKENLIAIKNCKTNKIKIFLETEECVVTKYRGKI